ncbi:MAG: hypothetical protein HYY01_08665 [Chloroflexi bacterium]|nr:hypothetical protein [Chloroflexota bacterium]
MQLRSEPGGILHRLVADTLRHRADTLEIEYKDGREDVCALRGKTGAGIASIESTSEDARTLREHLYAIGREGRSITVGGRSYHLTVVTYHSFGEDAFRVKIRKTPNRAIDADL